MNSSDMPRPLSDIERGVIARLLAVPFPGLDTHRNSVSGSLPGSPALVCDSVSVRDGVGRDRCFGRALDAQCWLTYPST
jgi:hypothetical protein